jgi:glutamyl-tRNA synthetase
MGKKVITRFAPSPTGFMHVGGIRTALYAWLLARKEGGRFILRIEDTDKGREVQGSIDHIIKSLKWLGLDWDEGPDVSGPSGPYKQSERLELYKKYAQILINKGHAYPDPYTKEELEALRKKAEVEKRPFLFRDHRPEVFGTWDGSRPLRFKVPKVKTYRWHDIVFGDLSAGPEALDDFILIKSDGYTTYNFAHIVDDIEMGITHVMRGGEFISSTPKFLAVYEALELEPPLYATLPLILSPDGKKKLSKRDGAKDLLEYKTEGYLPDAFINFLALLGWNPGDDKEIFTREELIQVFSIERIHKSGAVMSADKLDWINKEHLKKLPRKEVEKNILECLPDDMRNPKLIDVIFERISKWGDVKGMVGRGELDLFFHTPKYPKEKLIYKERGMESVVKNTNIAIKALTSIQDNDFNPENIKNVLMLVAEVGKSRGELLHPVRYALSGRDKSPDPFTIASIIGKDETLKRLQKAIEC